MPSPDVLVSNILVTYARATAEELENGAEWYAYAHLFARSLDRRNVKRAAGVIAALSPQLSWNENVKLANRAYSSYGPSGQTRANVEKVEAILKGHSPDDVLGGNKVRSFYACILAPHTSDAVVVDRHAAAVALGAEWCEANGGRWSDGFVKVLELAGVYDAIADAYRKASAELGTAPHVVQAVTWLTYRRELRPTTDSTFNRFAIEPACADCDRIVSRCQCEDSEAHPNDYF